MRISEIHIFQHDLPVKGGRYTMSGGEVTALDTTIVKLVADSGVVGWGETCPLGTIYQPQHAEGARAALKEMAPGLIGENILQPVLLYRKMNSLLEGHNYAKAAIDIALHDVLAKHFGLRVADILGGAVQERIPSYFATGIGEPDDIAKLAEDKVKEGFPRIQIKIGGKDVETDIETVHKVWEKVRGKAKIAADGNRGMNARDTLHLSRMCQEIPVTIEQPCRTLEEIASVRSRIALPIYLDENMTDLNTVLRVVGEGLCDGFGMKVTRIGGLSPMRTFREICETRSLPHTCDDTWGGDIVAAACTHIGATVQPKLLEGVWLSQPYIEGHYDPQNGIEIKEGHIQLPVGPGLGVEPDEGLFGAPVASY